MWWWTLARSEVCGKRAAEVDRTHMLKAKQNYRLCLVRSNLCSTVEPALEMKRWGDTPLDVSPILRMPIFHVRW